MVNRIALIFMFLTANVFSLEITDFFNTQNNCDYLVITPQIFSDGAEELVNYRNQNVKDDVKAAQYIILENLPQYNLNSAPDTLIRNALQWAIANWTVNPKYVVLIGDDAAQCAPGDSVAFSRGPMPTHMNGYIKTISSEMPKQILVDYSDIWYTKNDQGVSSFVIGRIPCENTQQLSTYIQKLKLYEDAKAGRWKNSVLYFADDSLQGSRIDLMDFERFIWKISDVFKNRFSKYVFLNEFTGQNRSINAKNVFFNAVNENVNWVIMTGHANPTMLTDENVLNASDKDLFKNTEKPVIFFSLTSSNGGFYFETEASMCKSYLFAPNGGAVAYIASPNTAYISYSYQMMLTICMNADKDPGISLGSLVASAYIDKMEFELFGDPAILSNQHRVVNCDASLNYINNTVILTIDNPSFNAGKCIWQINKKLHKGEVINRNVRDTLLAAGEQSLQSNSFFIQIPPNIPDSSYITCYIWNDSVEGRAGCEIKKETSVVCNNGHQKNSDLFHAGAVQSKSLKITFNNPLSKNAVLEIYQLNGCRTHEIIVPQGTESFRYDFSEKEKLSGIVVLVLRSAKKIVGRQLAHLL